MKNGLVSVLVPFLLNSWTAHLVFLLSAAKKKDLSQLLRARRGGGLGTYAVSHNASWTGFPSNRISAT